MANPKMKITIDFDSSWTNGFIDGNDGLNAKGKPNVRPFFATSKSKKLTDKPLSKDTVLGVLSRLIGDQRKLYEARQQKDFYFKGCEEAISYKVESNVEYEETAVVINKNDSRCAQTTHLGVLPNDCALFYSEFSKNLWCILELNIEEVCDYIIREKFYFEPQGKASINQILNRILDLTNKDITPQFETLERITERFDKQISQQKEKLASLDVNDKRTQKKSANINSKINQLLRDKESRLNNSNLIDSKVKSAAKKIESYFGGIQIINENAVYLIKLYGAALYLTAFELKRNRDVNFLSDQNKLSGFSGDSFSFNGIRDFLNTLAGARKKTVRTPALIKKQTGQLIIEVDEPVDTRDLYNKIENAGVSSFYLGKKGLAYVSDIRI